MASDSAHFYEPRSGHGLRHDPFNSIVGPRPIGWISTCSPDGVANLAPYSFFNALNYHPPLIGFSSIGWKDTLANIQATGEFCWNLTNRALAEAMNLSCTPAPPEVDEFAVSGLTKAPSRLIAAPRVLESPVNFECRLCDLIRLRGADGTEIDTWFVTGEVLAIHIDQAVLRDGVFDTLAADPVLRGGGPADYFGISEAALFKLRRPGWPLPGG